MKPTSFDAESTTKVHLNSTYDSPFLSYIKNSFDRLGLSDLFILRTTEVSSTCLSNKVKRRVKDQFLQKWISDMNSSNKSLFYRLFKTDFHFEPYLDLLSFKQLLNLTKFHFKSPTHRARVETGRWYNIERNERKCPFCANNILGDEFHFLFECPNLTTTRNICLKKYFRHNTNVFKVNTLVNSQNKNVLLKLCKLIQCIASLFWNMCITIVFYYEITKCMYLYIRT